ncbi:MAG: glycosyltransferase [Planctomycetota bacterium]
MGPIHPRDAGNESSGPLVSVLIPTFNRRRYLAQALASALRQSYENLQIIVVNDGGEDVSDIVGSHRDCRLTFIDRKENRGKAFSLNEALGRAEGKYVAYLDDDDLYYPHHIETLVNALETIDDCHVAYTDLYRVCCKIMPDGRRLVLGKSVEVSRDFDRFVMLHFNHVLHVSLMHRRDLLEKTGPYNEDLTVLIDWDMTRRLAFFSDFRHLCGITGEYYQVAGESDRISALQRKDKNEYLRNALAIRTARPSGPWPKIKDMSIIFLADGIDKMAAKTIASIWRYTFYPYKLYFPLPRADFERLDIKMPNIVYVPVGRAASRAERLDAALAACDGEYIAVAPSGYNVGEIWVEDSLHALINSRAGREGFELEGSTDTLWAAVFTKSDLLGARTAFGNLPVRQSLKAAGVAFRRVRPDQILFQFDQLLQEAQRTEAGGDCAKAAEIFEYIAEHYDNQLWMKKLAAEAFLKAGNYARAAELARDLNDQRPTVDTLLLEARLKRRENDFNSAIELLRKAEQILNGRELVWK